MKWTLILLALAGASVLLVIEKSTAAVLRSELDQRRSERAEVEMQRAEHARLFAQLPAADTLAQLQRAVAERAERQRTIETAVHAQRETQTFPQGEWLPPTQWQDRGCSTPTATLQTILWASAGGDTGRLANLLYFDEQVRAKLDKVYAALPAGARAAYLGPEQFMAAFTLKAIPPGEAQVVWQQESGDDAVVCLWINNSAAPPDEGSEKPVTDSKAPPMLPANPKRSQALLTLRRIDDSWRVIVPTHAVDKLARDLGNHSLSRRP